MPNECENYVEIHPTNIEEGASSLRKLLDAATFDPYKLFPPPPDTPEEDMNNYGYIHYGTKWMAQEASSIGGLCNGVDFLYLFFNSAWAPPEKFYKLLVREYPGIRVKFEYNEWQMGFCGHGEYDATVTDEQDPKHYNYDSPEELVTIQTGYNWTLVPWSPYFTEASPYNSSDDELEDDSE
jgi:hypothetical protein